MRTVQRVLARLLGNCRPRRMEREFSAELNSHLAMHAEENVRAGMTPEEARRRALIALGGVAQAREGLSDQSRLRWLEEMVQDARFGLRSMVMQPGFTIAVVLTLALGIAANDFVFSVMNGVLLRDLPLHEPARLLSIRTVDVRGEERGASYPDLLDLRERARGFSGLAAYRGEATFNISDDRQLPERIQGTYVTANTFAAIGKSPIFGRDFAPEDDRADAVPVAILGHGLWTSRYGANPGVVGRMIRLNGSPWTVVGIMPEAMKFPQNSEIWLPLGPASAQDARNNRRVQLFGRLAGTVTRDEGLAELEVLFSQLATEHPESNRGLRAIVRPLRPGIGWQWFVIFGSLMGAVGFVLLIACANVANLFLARSSRRSREMSVRLALGAGRGRLVRQLLVEALLFSAAAGLVAVALAVLALRLFVALVSQAEPAPYWMQFSLDSTAFGFFAAAAIGAGVLAGLVPAFRGSQASLSPAMKVSDRGTIGGSRRLAWTLVTAQLVLTLMLLVAAGAMMRRTLEASRVDGAIDTPDVLTLKIQLSAVDYPAAEERAAFVERLEDVLARDPEIGAFAISDGLPLSPGGRRMHLHDRGGGNSVTFPITSIAISPGYFATFRLPLLRGRDFTTGDSRTGVTPVIVNRRFAELYFPDQDPVGRLVNLSDSPSDQPVGMTIVGVSPQIRQAFDSAIEPVLYVPYRAQANPGVSLLVRSPAPVADLVPRIRAHVRSVDPELPVYDVFSMDQVVRRMVWLGRIVGGMFAIFAAMALALSVVGLYGVVSYSVSERTREIGVRMALGADRGQVLQLVLGRTVAHLAVGLALGIGGVFLVAPLLRGILVGDYATDPTTVAIITALFTVASLLASYLPARRAMQQSPSVALRYE